MSSEEPAPLSELLVVILLAVVGCWAGVPLVVRVTFPAILLWSLVVAVYAFSSYRRAWANKGRRAAP